MSIMQFKPVEARKCDQWSRAEHVTHKLELYIMNYCTAEYTIERGLEKRKENVQILDLLK